ncbi:MAG: PASTA domain-containing protein [Actinobacteria bacterium]|nr:PASTA domain-containing protein [Actinomycetota bacterium]
MWCSRCGSLNRQGVRFCEECGYTLGGLTDAAPGGPRCDDCGFLNREGVTFCETCGHPVGIDDPLPPPITPGRPAGTVHRRWWAVAALVVAVGGAGGVWLAQGNDDTDYGTTTAATTTAPTATTSGGDLGLVFMDATPPDKAPLQVLTDEAGHPLITDPEISPQLGVIARDPDGTVYLSEGDRWTAYTPGGPDEPATVWQTGTLAGRFEPDDDRLVYRPDQAASSGTAAWAEGIITATPGVSRRGDEWVVELGNGDLGEFTDALAGSQPDGGSMVLDPATGTVTVLQDPPAEWVWIEAEEAYTAILGQDHGAVILADDTGAPVVAGTIKRDGDVWIWETAADLTGSVAGVVDDVMDFLGAIGQGSGRYQLPGSDEVLHGSGPASTTPPPDLRPWLEAVGLAGEAAGADGCTATDTALVGFYEDGSAVAAGPGCLPAGVTADAQVGVAVSQQKRCSGFWCSIKSGLSDTADLVTTPVDWTMGAVASGAEFAWDQTGGAYLRDIEQCYDLITGDADAFLDCALSHEGETAVAVGQKAYDIGRALFDPEALCPEPGPGPGGGAGGDLRPRYPSIGFLGPAPDPLGPDDLVEHEFLTLARAWMPYVQLSREENCGEIKRIAARVFPYAADGSPVRTLHEADRVEIVYTLFYGYDTGRFAALISEILGPTLAAKAGPSHLGDSEGFVVGLIRTSETDGRCGLTDPHFEFYGARARAHLYAEESGGTAAVVAELIGATHRTDSKMYAGQTYLTDERTTVGACPPVGAGWTAVPHEAYVMSPPEGDPDPGLCRGDGKGAVCGYRVMVAEGKHANYFIRDGRDIPDNDGCEEQILNFEGIRRALDGRAGTTLRLLAPVTLGIIESGGGPIGAEECEAGRPYHDLSNRIELDMTAFFNPTCPTGDGCATDAEDCRACDLSARDGWEAGFAPAWPGSDTSCIQEADIQAWGDAGYQALIEHGSSETEATETLRNAASRTRLCSEGMSPYTAQTSLGWWGPKEVKTWVEETRGLWCLFDPPSLCGEIGGPGEKDHEYHVAGFFDVPPFGPLEADVPSLFGMTPEEARAALAPYFEYSEGPPTELDATNAHLDGLVYTQDPPAHVTSPVGATVVVSLGMLPLTEVPYLYGMTPAEARSELESAGLQYAEGTATELTKPEYAHLDGKVWFQDPPSESWVPVGTTVTVSLGVYRETLVEVPDLGQLDASEARQRLEALGLAYRVDGYVDLDPGDPMIDRVVDQDPWVGTMVARGTTVGVTLGRQRASTAMATVVDAEYSLRSGGEQESGVRFGATITHSGLSGGLYVIVAVSYATTGNPANSRNPEYTLSTGYLGTWDYISVEPAGGTWQPTLFIPFTAFDSCGGFYAEFLAFDPETSTILDSTEIYFEFGC